MKIFSLLFLVLALICFPFSAHAGSEIQIQINLGGFGFNVGRARPCAQQPMPYWHPGRSRGYRSGYYQAHPVYVWDEFGYPHLVGWRH